MLLTLVGAGLLVLAQGGAPSWQLDSTRSEKTDKLSLTLYIEAVSPVPPPPAARPHLVLRCREQALEVFVLTGMALSGAEGATPVRIRWGNAAPQETMWNRSDDRKSAFARVPWEFVDQLIKQPNVRIEVHPSDAAPTTIAFNGRGLDRYMLQLVPLCPFGGPQAASRASFEPNADQVFMESVVDERPEVLSGPRIVYPDLLRQAGVQGRVIVQTIVDTLGRAEPGSVKIIQSPNPGFDGPAKEFVLGARFKPARVHGRAVRVLVNLPIDFSVRRDRPPIPPPPPPD